MKYYSNLHGNDYLSGRQNIISEYRRLDDDNLNGKLWLLPKIYSRIFVSSVNQPCKNVLALARSRFVTISTFYRVRVLRTHFIRSLGLFHHSLKCIIQFGNLKVDFPMSTYVYLHTKHIPDMCASRWGMVDECARVWSLIIIKLNVLMSTCWCFWTVYPYTKLRGKTLNVIRVCVCVRWWWWFASFCGGLNCRRKYADR